MSRSLCSIAAVAIFLMTAGCGKGKNEIPGQKESGGVEVKKLEPEVAGKLSGHGISSSHVSFIEYSPDSTCLAVAVDSSIRFGPGDKMWSQELPADWFGIRSRRMIYVFMPAADSIFKVEECEEIVNFYRKSDSLPVMAERWERYGAVIWSPDSKKLLLLKDREAEGLESQDALIFTPGVHDPAFLDLSTVWRQLMMANPGAQGTKVEKITWSPESLITIDISLKGIEPPVKKELVFDASSTRLISNKNI